VVDHLLKAAITGGNGWLGLSPPDRGLWCVVPAAGGGSLAGGRAGVAIAVTGLLARVTPYHTGVLPHARKPSFLRPGLP